MMFRHLLNVKRTQQDLQRVWAKHMGTKNQTNCISHVTRVWLLRMHMAFLVDNLQYYLQVTRTNISTQIVITDNVICLITYFTRSMFWKHSTHNYSIRSIIHEILNPFVWHMIILLPH